GPEPGPEVEQVAGGQPVVDGDAGQAHVDELVERARVAGAPLDGPAERSADEVLLAGDAPEVGPGVLPPLAVDELGVVAGAPPRPAPPPRARGGARAGRLRPAPRA